MTKPKTEKAKEHSEPSFEKALHRLEEIVSQLEQADAPLDKALTLYEEGVKLSRVCSQQLQDAERRVELLEDKNGRLKGKPLGGGDDDGDEDYDSGEPEDDESEGDDDEATSAQGGRPSDTLF
jgi:exodeoxyribonuclease VII small subunit